MLKAVNAKQAEPITLEQYLADPHGWYEATVINAQLGTRYTADEVRALPDELLDVCLAMNELPPDNEG